MLNIPKTSRATLLLDILRIYAEYIQINTYIVAPRKKTKEETRKTERNREINNILRWGRMSKNNNDSAKRQV